MKHPDDSYLARAIASVNAHEPNLWEHLDRVPLLPPGAGRAILEDFLELACRCQHLGNITIGRRGLLDLPREWVLRHIEPAIEPLLQREEEWEYRRLLEACWPLDKDLVEKLARRGLDSPDPGIREAAGDCLKTLACPAARQSPQYWEREDPGEGEATLFKIPRHWLIPSRHDPRNFFCASIAGWLVAAELVAMQFLPTHEFIRSEAEQRAWIIGVTVLLLSLCSIGLRGLVSGQRSRGSLLLFAINLFFLGIWAWGLHDFLSRPQ